MVRFGHTDINLDENSHSGKRSTKSTVLRQQRLETFSKSMKEHLHKGEQEDAYDGKLFGNAGVKAEDLVEHR